MSKIFVSTLAVLGCMISDLCIQKIKQKIKHVKRLSGFAHILAYTVLNIKCSLIIC